MSDLIERQAAIRKLKRMATQAYIDKLNGSAETVINCCIDVIERQIPSAQPEPCEDAVSREAAIDAALSAFSRGLLASPDIRKLPSVTPKRKNGKWLCSDDLYETAVCSCCGWDTTEPWQHIKSWFEFCPHCGADMRGEQDE